MTSAADVKGARPLCFLANDRLLRALAREPVDRTPVWFMRQAGRYLPEYRATRARAGSFLGLATAPELACEVTLQPLARYALDAAILFSDILMIPKAMGVGLAFEEGEGPRIERPVRSAADIAALPVPDVGRELRFVMDAVALIRRELAGRVPLIGFAGSPWTVATYMIEGGGSREFARAKALLYGDPKALHALLGKLARATTDYLNAQVAAGAQAVMIFDTWGGILATPAYYEFSLGYMEQVVGGLVRQREGRQVPVILFTKGGGAWLERLGASGADALGIDWTTELSVARRDTFGRVALQGNLDPGVLFAPPAAIRAEVARVLESYGRGPGHVFNLGHGIQPGVDPEHVAAMVAAVHELSPQYHR
jgi:uroporphyrinogen decarboxylase